MDSGTHNFNKTEFRSKWIRFVGIVGIIAALAFSLSIMGFFDKLFSKSNNESSQTSVHLSDLQYEANWVIYFSRLSDETVGSIMVDIGLNSIAPVENRTILLRIAIQMNSPREDGLSSGDESTTLNKIDDQLADALKKRHDAIYAGRVNGEGKLRLHLYLGNSEGYQNTVSSVMSSFPAYRFESAVEVDETWEVYRNGLYPEPIEMQSIQNGLVVENLRKNGDNLEQKRPVQHWMYFSAPGDREKFLEKISGMGFEIIVQEKDDLSKQRPYKLVISRNDLVDHNSVDDYVLVLWQLANEFGGGYDGWETLVVRN